MTKLNEISDPPERQAKTAYVNELWAGWREARLQTLSRITNYLFVLNTGALLASLTYVATKPANSYIQCSIWLFSIGVFFCVLHATFDYYVTETRFSTYRKDTEELYNNKIDWEIFVDRSKNYVTYDSVLHLLGWLSGLVFFVGLIIGVRQIQ